MVTMAGIIPVFILLDDASIYTFLDLAFNLVDLVLWVGVRTLCHHKAFKLWSELEAHLDQLFARQGSGQRSKRPFVDELIETRFKIHALQFLRKILVSMDVALPRFPVCSYAA